MTKTYTPKASEIERRWFVVDAEGQTLGRLATRVARLLVGKHKPTYATHIDTGDHVIIVNAGKVKVTGKKLQSKLYSRHSGYPGGLKEITAGKLMEKAPTRVVEFAIRGMLPRGPLGRQMGRKLKVYAGVDHPHQAQKPQELKLPQADRRR